MITNAWFIILLVLFGLLGYLRQLTLNHLLFDFEELISRKRMDLADDLMQRCPKRLQRIVRRKLYRQGINVSIGLPCETCGEDVGGDQHPLNGIMYCACCCPMC